jgi:hypothetical protein
MTHRIRLRAPWGISLLNEPTANGQAVAGQRFRTTLSRRFNTPTGLTGTDKVEICVRAKPGIEFDCADLSGTKLACNEVEGTWRFSVEAILGTSQTFSLTVSWDDSLVSSMPHAPSSFDQFAHEAWLEIFSPDN